jgi:hypothetical protein
MKRATLVVLEVLAVLFLLLGGQWQSANAGTLTGTVGLGVGPGEVNNLSVAFDSTSTPGVSITKVTFDTAVLGVVVNSPSGGGGVINNGVVSPSFFGALGSSTFGLTATSFLAGASYFDSELNLTLSGSIAIDFNGATATVDFSNGSSATATLAGPVSGSNALGSFSEWQSTFTGTGGGSAVPEPASLTLLGIAFVGVAGYTWRWRKMAEVCCK